MSHQREVTGKTDFYRYGVGPAFDPTPLWNCSPSASSVAMLRQLIGPPAGRHDAAADE